MYVKYNKNNYVMLSYPSEKCVPRTNFSDKKQLFINDIKCRALRKVAVFSKYFSCDLD